MITGDPGAVEDAALDLESSGRALDEVVEDVGHHRRAATAHWSGDASDAANDALDRLGGRVSIGGPSCRSVATVLFDYARELRAAQQEYAAQQVIADAASASLDEQGRLAADEADLVTARRSVTAARTAMVDAVERARRADEDAARQIDALVPPLADMGGPGTAAAPVVLGPPSPGVGPKPLTVDDHGHPPAGPPPVEQDHGVPWKGIGHTFLDAAGFIPGAGAIFDGANAVWYAAEGDYVDAAFSAAAMVPGAGDAVAAARLGAKGLKAAEGAVDAERAVQTARTIAPTTVIPSSGKTWVSTGRGTVYDVPAGWTQRMADNDKGLVFQRLGAQDDRDLVRIMEPTQRYPDGYVRVHNSHNQPVTPLGKAEGRAATHISQLHQGPFPAWPPS